MYSQAHVYLCDGNFSQYYFVNFCYFRSLAYTILQDGPEKTHKKLQYTVLMQLFQIKSNGFHPSVFKVQGNKDYVATFMKLLHIPCKFAQSYDARLADDIL